MKKLTKTVIPITLFVILLIAAIIGTLYGAVSYADLPINLPKRAAYIPNTEIPSQSVKIMNQWGNITYYTPPNRPDDFQQIIDSGVLNLAELSKGDFYVNFPILDEESVEQYLDDHPEEVENGYETLFIDKVDYLNTPTGMKTIYGHDVLAIDAVNKIVIVGIDVPNGSNVSKVKLAIVYNKTQMDMSLVADLSYWDIIEKHANNTGAILALNASSYNWHSSGSYAILYGATKWHGEVFRKASETTNLIKFDEAGNLSIGGTIDDAYNAIEMMPILMQNGTVMHVDPSKDTRAAQSAIGQTQDGVTLMLIGSGSTYGSNMGITETEMLEILKQYGAYNAATLSGGSRAIMWWNGRVVNETVGYSQVGVRLPNAFIVVPFITDMATDVFDDGKGNTELTDNMTQNEPQVQTSNESPAA